MFMVKCKYFADANITNILNIRKFFAIFFKKNSPSPPHSLIFATKARGKPTSQRVNKPTSQRANELKSDKSDESDRSDKRWSDGSDGSDGSENKIPPSAPPKKLVDLLAR